MTKVGRPPIPLNGKAPKHQRIREAVRKKIADGTYPAGSQLPADSEFYKLFKVNKLTVVRALNDLAREGLVIRRQGSGSYVADRRVPSILPGRTLRLGVLCRRKLTPDDLLHQFHGHITKGVLDVFGLTDVQPEWPSCGQELATRAVWTSPDRAITLIGLGEAAGAQVRHPPLEEIAAARLDGVITASIISEEFLQALQKLGIPMVLADHLNERFALSADQVFMDPLPAHRAVVRHFVSQGLKRIHFVGGFTSIPAPLPSMSHEDIAAFRQGRMQIDPDSILRMGAWRLGMHECGITAPESWAHFENPWFVKDQELAKKLLALPADERPEAVICHNVDQAQNLMEIFSERGVRLMAAGVTDRGYGGAALPIRAFGRELGASAAELLISRFHRPSRLHLRVGVPMVFTPPEAQHMPQAVAPSEMASR